MNIYGVLGVGIAMLMSWSEWHSIGWAAIAGFFNWFYVLYYLMAY